MPIATKMHDLIQRAHFVRETYSTDNWSDIKERSKSVLQFIAREKSEITATPEMERTRHQRLRIFFLDYVHQVANDIYREASIKMMKE